jgi:hypothetical protein
MSEGPSRDRDKRLLPRSKLCGTMDERERRIGLNEAVFREANERIEDLNQSFATITDELVLVCECGDGKCVDKISMSPAAYEELRADATHFAIVPGHEISDVEQVVARRDGYHVVRKNQGIPRRIAELTDPR